MIIKHACLFLWCITATWTRGINFLVPVAPKWTQTFSDENLTNVPKPLIELHDRRYYSMMNFIQNMFSSQYHKDKFRKSQVITLHEQFYYKINDTR